MDTDIVRYIRKRITADFQKCKWEDSVGQGFRDTRLVSIENSLDGMETVMEEIQRFIKDTENLLATAKTENR